MAFKKCSKTLPLLVSLLVPITAQGNPFGALGDAINKVTQSKPTEAAPNQKVTNQAGQAANALQPGTTANQVIVYEGYSKEMLPIKSLMQKGKLTEAVSAMETKHPDPDKLNMLDHLQFGLLSLDQADFRTTDHHFTKAERDIESEKDRSTVSNFFARSSDTALSTLTGNQELGQYDGAGFERVLMLNYKSIAHMLDGKRTAYNITRRAINLQNIEKKKFDALMRAAEDEIKKHEAEQKEQGADLEQVGFDKIVDQQYKSSNKKALSVPSAFVNPFGFYVAGMVQELDSYEDPSLRDNAKISYQKALELNPKSLVIKKALKDIKQPAIRNKRLVNVIVGDGFSPEKKLLKFDLSMGLALPTVIELPLYEPSPNKVHRIEVQTTTGKRWSRLSEVADITALALRYQKDASALAQLRMMSTVIRNVIEGHAWNQATQEAGFFGSVIEQIKTKRDEMVHPDMRSWSTLPSRLLAARFYVPMTVSRLKIVSYDVRGKILNSQVVEIDKNTHNVVYVRTLDHTIYATSNKPLWVGI